MSLFKASSLLGRLSQTARLSSCKLPTATTKPAPLPEKVNPQNAQFDQVTHTGQAWDQADYRLARFNDETKTVNPNVAADLIAETPLIASHDRIVKCDGGHPALGHPAVFINLDKPGTHACGYCGQRFYNSHTTSEEQKSIHHIEV